LASEEAAKTASADRAVPMTDTPEAVSQPTRSRRSIVLRLAAWFANLYLLAFTVDGVWSLVDLALDLPDLNTLQGSHPALATAVGALAAVLIAASLVMPYILLFVPHLPKLPFLLPIAFILLILVLAGMWEHDQIEVFHDHLNLVEFLIAVTSLLLLRVQTGGWLLSPATLPRKRHLVARTVFATIVAVVATASLAPALLVVTLASALERQTGGWLDVTPSTIELRESVLEKDGRTVVLTAMVHLGEEDFYRTIFDDVPAKSLILAEGITDREKRSLGFPSAMKIASALGLTGQPDPGTLPSVLEARRAEAAEAHPEAPARVRPDVVLADVDMADFSPVTLEIFHGLADAYDGDSIADSIRRAIAATRAHSSEDLATFRHDVIDNRNAKLLATFDEKAPAYETIVIPWGVMHMRGIEAGLKERGYRVETERQRTAVRFSTILGWLSSRRRGDPVG
jgi:hypothetical protein